MGVLICLNAPTQPMRDEAASAGFYTSPWGKHPKVQLVTVGELLARKRLDMPSGGAHMTQVAMPPTPEPTVSHGECRSHGKAVARDHGFALPLFGRPKRR